jgi:M6 family metalloprotease-like protein
VGAVFLRDYPATVTQPDGSRLSVLLSGDEFYNWVTDTDGFVILRDHDSGYCVYAAREGDRIVPTKSFVGRDNPRLRALSPHTLPSESFMRGQRKRWAMPARSGMPRGTTGSRTLNNVVIFIRFSDEAEYTSAASTYDGMFNGAAGTNSLRNYYAEASYSQLTISTSFYPPAAGSTVVSYQDSHDRGYYQPYDQYVNSEGYQNDTDRTIREQTLLQRAVTAVAPQIPADLNVDSDGDGNVDNVCFVVQGSPGAWSSLLWPHMWELYAVTATINGKRVWTYNFQLEDVTLGRSSAATGGPGVLCHEMFHSLGAPDLYHYSYDGISPAGGWDIMDGTTNPPQHMSAYMKWKYGHWIDDIPTITATGDYNVYPLTSATQNCYKVQSPVDPNEFFVLEYRNKTGLFEASTPDCGLLVWRVNTEVGDGNASGPPDEIYAYRPGGTLTFNGTVASAAMYSPGNASLNGITNPSCFLTDGRQGGLDCAATWPKYMAYMPVHVNILDPVRRLVFQTQPTDANAGAAIAPAPSVAVVDASGNVETGFAGTVTVAVQPPRTGVVLAGTTTVSFANGVATLPGLSLNMLGAAHLTATAAGLVPVDSATFSVVGSAYQRVTTLRVGANPWGIAVNPVTDRIYVGKTNDSAVSVIDGATNAKIAEITGLYWPRGIAVNAAANKVYAVNQGSNSVSVINGATNLITKTISVGSNPWAASFSPASNRLYVGNRNDGSISVIDGTTDSVVTTITSIPNRAMMALNPATNRIFVPGASDGLVRVIACDTNTVVATISGSGTPLGLAVDATLNRLYVSDIAANQIATYDATSFASRTRVSVGTYPYGVAANPSTGHVFTDCQMTDDVVVVDGAAEAALTAVSDGSQPISAAVNQTTNRAYVANWNSGTVSVIQDNPSGSPLHLDFTTQPGSSARGASLGSQPVVTVKDASGAIQTAFSGKIALLVQPDTSAAVLQGAGTVDVVNGRAVFSGLSLVKPGRYLFKAYSGTLTPATSAPFWVTPTISDVVVAAKEAAGLQQSSSTDTDLYNVVMQGWPLTGIDMLDVVMLARLADGLG